MLQDDTATAVLEVPSNNPVIPLNINIDFTDGSGGYSYIFSGFDPNYLPVDDDFIVPADCQPIGKGDPPPIHFPLPHSLHSFRSKKKIHHHMKMNHMKSLHEYKKIPNLLRKRMKKLRKWAELNTLDLTPYLSVAAVDRFIFAEIRSTIF